MPETDSPYGRVILSATCYADAEAALHLAVLLARHVGAGLHGLLITDDTILAAAGHPHARMVSFSGKVTGQVTVETMRAAFRADARLFEKRLTDAAQKVVLDTGFSAIGGRLTAVLAQFARAQDIVIVGFRRALRDGDTLVLVLGGYGSGDEQLALALYLSAAVRKRLVVFATPRQEGEVAAGLARRGGTKHHEVRPYTGTGNLLRELKWMSPAAVIVASGQVEPLPIAALIDAARCPLILTVPEVEGA